MRRLPKRISKSMVKSATKKVSTVRSSSGRINVTSRISVKTK